MKRKILWITLIILTIFLIYIIYIKISDINNKNTIDIEPNYNIYPEKPILSVWDSYKKEIYKDDKLISEERKIISLVFYELTVNICIQETNTCEELDYTETEEEINIKKGNTIDFYGKFNKVKHTYINTLILEEVVDETNKILYYFSQPAG